MWWFCHKKIFKNVTFGSNYVSVKLLTFNFFKQHATTSYRIEINFFFPIGWFILKIIIRIWWMCGICDFIVDTSWSKNFYLWFLIFAISFPEYHLSYSKKPQNMVHIDLIELITRLYMWLVFSIYFRVVNSNLVVIFQIGSSGINKKSTNYNICV